MNTKNILIGSSVVVIAFLIWKMKKNKDLQLAKDKKAELDYAEKLQKESKVYAETMNVDLINEKNAKTLLSGYNSVWKRILALPTHTASDKNYLALKKQISDLDLQLKSLGYKVTGNPRNLSGMQLVKI